MSACHPSKRGSLSFIIHKAGRMAGMEVVTCLVDKTAFCAELTRWRQDFHQHPEFGFEEHRTSRLVAERLHSFGLTDIVEGVGGTGIVASLTLGHGNRAIALRADMDALRIDENSDLPYRSRVPGTMHACGHDGHIVMLLGAAKMLAAEGGFDGTVRFLFQPAEEWGRGAQAMLADGLMRRFPFQEIFGLHNMPGLALGRFETRPGPIMAAEDNFEIILRGQGGHAARPQAGREVLVATCALVVNLQTIVSRRLDPADISVVSVTELLTDGTRNALPGLARILGDARSFRPEVSATIEAQMRRIATGTAAAYDCDAEIHYSREFVPLLNDAALTGAALAVAAQVFGKDQVRGDCAPIAASEDFARFLDVVPGCFAFIGNGADSTPLHNPAYDFNDAAIPLGVEYLTRIVRDRLPLLTG
jgi:hippurate hydrolase